MVPVRLRVICWAAVAEGVMSHLREGDVVLITGSLQNHRPDPTSIVLVASVVQFLTSDDAANKPQ